MATEKHTGHGGYGLPSGHNKATVVSFLQVCAVRGPRARQAGDGITGGGLLAWPPRQYLLAGCVPLTPKLAPTFYGPTVLCLSFSELAGNSS